MSERIAVQLPSDGASHRREDACRVGVLRRVAAARLRFCGLEALIDDVMLVVSELLTNALLHSGGTEIVLRLRVEDGFLRVIVVDGMPGCAVPKAAEADAESGRGLALVEAVAGENGGAWGTSEDGFETWCSLRVPGEEAP